jgi:hypothetical protein
MKLTDKSCKAAKAENKAHKLSDGGGLFLLVQPNGKKYWRMKYRIGGKEKLLSFGEYPLIPLIDARAKRENAKKLIADGLDPSLKKKLDKRQKQTETENSFQAVTMEWIENHFDDKTERYRKTVLSRFERDLFPAFGTMPINDIEAPEILETLRKVEKRGAHELAGRLRGLCGQIFRYGIVTGKAKRNPAQDLQGALKPYKKNHHASIDTNEIFEFVKTLEQNHARLYRHTQLAVKMLMLTLPVTADNVVNDVTQLGNTIVSKTEDAAFFLAEKREELWDKGQINDRLAGAAITGKFGILAGPLAKIAIPAAALYGFAKGPEIVAKHDRWLEEQRKKRKDNTPKV